MIIKNLSTFLNNMDLDLQLSSYDYDLPENAIAQLPTTPVHNAKLLICQKKASGISYKQTQFIDLINHLNSDYLLFLNKTKVFKARIPLSHLFVIKNNGEKALLEQGEIFIYNLHNHNQFEALVSDGKHFKPGSEIIFNDEVRLLSLFFTDNGIMFEIKGNPILNFLEQYGEMPLPPYIKYTKEKEQRYQTHFAQEIGSAAAPTASLHFSPELLSGLKQKGVDIEQVCLHVGLGTFKPVREEDIRDQKLHFEPMIIPQHIWNRIYLAKIAGKKLLPIGTTMVRYLESLPYIWKFLKQQKKLNLNLNPSTIQRRDTLTQEINNEQIREFIPNQKIACLNTKAYSIQTRLFLRPGIKFFLVDELISNFHLPKSSLLMLISAFMGRENALNAYSFAIKNNFKFYSFGDGMWIRSCNSKIKS